MNFQVNFSSKQNLNITEQQILEMFSSFSLLKVQLTSVPIVKITRT